VALGQPCDESIDRGPRTKGLNATTSAPVAKAVTTSCTSASRAMVVVEHVG